MKWLPGLPLLSAACVAWANVLSLPVGAVTDPAWPEIRADYRAGRYEEALGRLEQLLGRVPSQREAHYYVALIHWHLQHYDASKRAWRKVLELDPQGPFGADAALWLTTLDELEASEKPLAVVSSTPMPSPSVLVSPKPLSRASSAPVASPAEGKNIPTPGRSPSASSDPWLQAQPNVRGRRLRSRNAKPGYFKALDGTFEFVPPTGFVLLDEGEDGGERRALFGPRRQPRSPRHSEQPPTLLMVWREVPELRRYRVDQRAARSRQMLMLEASTYGPGAQLESRFGVQTVRIAQRQGSWSAETWLFFQDERLYAFTYGGETSALGLYSQAVNKSFLTLAFYP
jgi:hypothetical protein